MNFGRTVALVAAAAGAVVLGAADAGAVGTDSHPKQTSNCDSDQALSFGGPPSRPNCVNFVKDIKDLTQWNNCDAAAGPTGIGGSAVSSSKLVEGSRCANIAVADKSSKSKSSKH